MIHHGDLFDVLPTLDVESIDACVTDPPYGIGFMGREWDTFKPEKARASKKHAITVGEKGRRDDNPNLRGRRQSPAMSPSQIEYNRSLEGQRGFQEWTERWAREVFRVLKPGAYIVVCGAPRSFHRMTCGLEDAGFEIRDCLSWLYGQGFPKSLNVGDGRGTALKPSWEPCVLGRKPFKGGLKGNLRAHGTGALNIDACRIESGRDHAEKCASVVGLASNRNGACYGEWTGAREDSYSPLGRWPANVVLDEDAAAMLDEQAPDCGGGNKDNRGQTHGFASPRTSVRDDVWSNADERGGASRFYYVAKPSREERDYGIYDLAPRSAGEATDRVDGTAGQNSPRAGAGRTGGARNIHPTVKPVELMRWLVRLVTPIDGLVLDPFTGSGTTGMACRYEQRRFVGVEREAEYLAIAERRIAAVAPLFGETA